ncbi:MAG TPA: tetratricopeptide repeat protein [Polyangiales bacterium]|nr:tetratricopeptide repeat protein [Polyangiales bacterium]
MASAKQEVIDLALVRTDGWFEQLAEEIPEFPQLCELLGQRFVAFSFIAGVRITAIAYDPQSPENSVVDFDRGEDEASERLSLAEFREALGAALTGPDVEPVELPEQPSLEDVRACIGRRYLLLAPVFGIHVAALHANDGVPMIEVDLGHAREEISVQGLREILDGAVSAEVARARPAAPFSIDFKRIPMAERANERGEYDETITLLGAWPGPLSMFLRTPQGQALGRSERSRLVKALGLLGQAYMHKQQAEWAEDVLRLGIQFGQELEAAGPLFGSLGRTRVESGRHGEAIGLLRRALSLGGDKASLNLDLARCFYERKRYVAALACLHAAEAAGCEKSAMKELRAAVETALGGAYQTYRARCGGSV